MTLASGSGRSYQYGSDEAVWVILGGKPEHFPKCEERVEPGVEFRKNETRSEDRKNFF